MGTLAEEPRFASRLEKWGPFPLAGFLRSPARKSWLHRQDTRANNSLSEPACRLEPEVWCLLSYILYILYLQGLNKWPLDSNHRHTSQVTACAVSIKLTGFTDKDMLKPTYVYAYRYKTAASAVCVDDSNVSPLTVARISGDMHGLIRIWVYYALIDLVGGPDGKIFGSCSWHKSSAARSVRRPRANSLPSFIIPT